MFSSLCVRDADRACARVVSNMAANEEVLAGKMDHLAENGAYSDVKWTAISLTHVEYPKGNFHTKFELWGPCL